MIGKSSIWTNKRKNLGACSEGYLTISIPSKGNAQGKYQPPNALPGFEKPFLISPLWNGVPINVKIIPSRKPLFASKLDASLSCLIRRKRGVVFSLWSKGGWHIFIKSGRKVEGREAKKRNIHSSDF